MSYFDFKPHPHCDITQFIRELEIRHRDWLEVAILKAAHHSYHAVLMDIANRKITGEEVDFEIEFAPDSPLERASAAVVAAVWRLERRLHSMAG
ncbi:hypothetical protein FHS83_002004 [Rhizomicrobium palustre]|uniref:Uncharacterized protein n=1 Tax=Rhizomicrobium palustre TaxID=189966 RepID=A0A846MZ14_9PROT|nr:hypothetical protein [Rhizomicrobium palustre]NIK88686.1 hypothetical protein [Rhizomicrobium palustre]